MDKLFDMFVDRWNKLLRFWISCLLKKRVEDKFMIGLEAFWAPHTLNRYPVCRFHGWYKMKGMESCWDRHQKHVGHWKEGSSRRRPAQGGAVYLINCHAIVLALFWSSSGFSYYIIYSTIDSLFNFGLWSLISRDSRPRMGADLITACDGGAKRQKERDRREILRAIFRENSKTASPLGRVQWSYCRIMMSSITVLILFVEESLAPIWRRALWAVIAKVN